MKKLSVFGLCVFVGLVGCLSTPFDSLVPDEDNFDFETTCKDTTGAADECSDCCDGIGADTSLETGGECGCGYTVVDSDRCSSAGADLDTCSTCCEMNDANFSTSLSGGVCICRSISKTKPAGTMMSQNSDGCETNGQSCTCSNTQASGMCGTGPIKEGLYCQCD